MESFIVISLIKVVVIFAVLLTTLAYLQWVERKVIAHIQVRPGPYRVGPHGLLQPLADVIKLITKEDLRPPFVHTPIWSARSSRIFRCVPDLTVWARTGCCSPWPT